MLEALNNFGKYMKTLGSLSLLISMFSLGLMLILLIPLAFFNLPSEVFWYTSIITITIMLPSSGMLIIGMIITVLTSTEGELK
jgi:hypothetical protein